MCDCFDGKHLLHSLFNKIEFDRLNRKNAGPEAICILCGLSMVEVLYVFPLLTFLPGNYG